MTQELFRLLHSAGDTKAENRQVVMRSVMARPGNQRDLVRRTGRSKAMISAAVSELRSAGVFLSRQDGRDDVVRMAPTRGITVGVELGYQHATILARRVDQEYDQVKRAQVESGASTSAHQWPATVAGRIRDLANQVADDGAEHVVTVGLGVPRMVDPRTQELTPPLLPPWENQASPGDLLAEKLAELLGYEVRVVVDNIANLAALGESTYGNHDRETLLLVRVSTGVGAGLVIGGNLIRGRMGIAGEMGHMVVDPSGRFCPCGGRGCLETLIGADALLAQANLSLGTQSASRPQSLDELIRRADRGDLVCGRVLRDAAENLGRTLGNICNLLSPDVIVIGATWGTPPAAKLILDSCYQGLRKTALTAAHAGDFCLTASRVRDAEAQGALVMGILGTRLE